MSTLEKKAAGKVVVVTGASAGVGRAVVQRFAADGARLALIARDAEALEEARAEAERLGATAAAFPLDVADAEAVFSAAREIESRLGPIDIWINNAMVTVFSKLWDLDPRGVPARHRGHLFRLCLRHDGCAAAHAPQGPRHNRPGRIGPGLSRHPAAIPLLRGQARRARLHRFAQDRAPS